LLSLLVLLPALLILAAPAPAAFPGTNGKIAFTDGGLWVINPDGTGSTEILDDSGRTLFSPAWSPDGQKIAFQWADAGSPQSFEIYTVNADGSGLVQLTNDPVRAVEPAWSPDGKKIAFLSLRHEADPQTCAAYGGDCNYDTYVINADGSGETRLTNSSTQDGRMTWSPDGQRIAFDFRPLNDLYELGVMNADGSNQQQITTTPSGEQAWFPDWSPDSSRIVYTRTILDPICEPGCGDNHQIYTIEPDGTNPILVKQHSFISQVWSPDGTTFVLAVCGTSTGIYTMNSDGTNQQLLTNQGFCRADWQPILPGYARPKGATKMVLRFVPAYESCTTPNAKHGAPLAVSSCNPAVATSDFLTVGTPESNGVQANSVGLASLRAICNPPGPGGVPPCSDPGDQGDEELQISITDVRQKQSLLDYSGELEARVTLRITDRWNGLCAGCRQPGTAMDIPFSFAVPCATTASAATGSTCSVTTTANAVAPGAAREGTRSVWQLGRFELYDGGPDGDADTPSGNTLFAEQGLFVP
jgi:Tol biopolymer transport system component